MIGTTTKVSRCGANKSKNNIGVPIIIKSFPPDIADSNTSIGNFLNSTSGDEQLAILKNIIDGQKDANDSKVIEFFVIVFYEAPAKHPVKSFLMRYITKCSSIQKLFTELLSARILADLNEAYDSYDYEKCSKLVPKVFMCVENFPAGAAAVDHIDSKLLMKRLFFDYFADCRRDLRMSPLSPTKKNEMFNLEHLMLRLVMHLVQKVDLDEEKLLNWCSISRSVMFFIDKLISDEEVPMDTKTLSGILFLSMLNFDFVDDKELAWKMVLESGETTFSHILESKAGQLAVYSAIATTVPMGQLKERLYNGDSAYILVLLHKLLDFADGSATDSAFTLIATRSLLHLSKSLSDIKDKDVGLRVVPLLLDFVWPHLEFHLDSVRHLTQQILLNVMGYCAELEQDVDGEPGNPEPLASLLQSIRSLGRRRSFYWSVSGGAAVLGASRVLRELCDANELLAAASSEHLRAAVSGAITALVSGSSGDAEAVFQQWVWPAMPVPAARDVVIAAAVQKHPQIVDLICGRAAGAALLRSCRAAPRLVSRVPRGTLPAAAVTHDAQMRLVSLSLSVESRRSTAALSQDSLSLVLTFLRYNINSPQPGFQHAMLANVKKLLKRLEDSYRVLKRQSSGAEYYIEFVEKLRQLCYKSALPGTNYGRRSAALQILACTERLQLDTHQWVWKEEYVERLLAHLDDSYDTNKALALQVLEMCPEHLLKDNKYSTSLELSDILRQATSLRPADSAAAAYKLLLLLSKAKERILEKHPLYTYRGDEEWRAHYVLVQVLLGEISHERVKLERDHVSGLFGVLHCLAAVLRNMDLRPAGAVLPRVVQCCLAAVADALPAVACAAPEGHLPDSDLTLEDGRPVTAQMVLVCAWRTVKEAAGALARAAGRGGAPAAGRALLGALLAAQHRGASDQAAAALHDLAQQYWLVEDLQRFPRLWLQAVMQETVSGEHRTRRGAGLPAAVQALVSSELVTGRAAGLHECMCRLLRQAAAEDACRRTLAANVLRALFRSSALESAVQQYVSAGLQLAIRGFDASAWPERSAMSLLLSAVLVRTFGVSRSRAAAPLHARNKMSAATFFQRYPQLYDLMLSKLSEEQISVGGGSSFAVLLVLARLYPSALEGAASNLKLSAFLPLVQRWSGSAVLKTRQLAAAALRGLVAPNEYFSYISQMFGIISDRGILRNYCHGILLQLARLLEDPPTSPTSCPPETYPFTLQASLWILAQSGGSTPCYVIAREYVNVINLLLWRFPVLIEDETVAAIRVCLKNLLFSDDNPAITTGREVCLTDCLYLYLIILYKDKNRDQILQVTLQTLRHQAYEVVLASLNHLLMLFDKLDTEDCYFQQHLNSVCDKRIIELIRNSPEYINILNEVMRNCKYLECQRKSLRLITLEDNTQMVLIGEEMPLYISLPYDWMIQKLIKLLRSLIEDDNVTHMYLESLLRLTSVKLRDSSINTRSIIAVMRMVYELSSSKNSDATRLVVVSYLEQNLDSIMSVDFGSSPWDKFNYMATVLATLVTLLEDDDDDIRQRVADLVTKLVRPVLFENVSPEQVPLENMSPEQVPLENMSPEQVPLENMSPEQVPLENMSPEQVPLENMSPEQVPLENMSPEQVPLENMSPEQVPLENMSPEHVQLKNAALGDGLIEKELLAHVLVMNEGRVVPSLSGEMLRDYIETLEHNTAFFVVLALLDFKSEVCMTDELSDECRVFDQSERYNLFLEESVWSVACAEKIMKLNQHIGANLVDYILSILYDKKYIFTFEVLCKDNFVLFDKLAKGSCLKNEIINPKIELFVQKLRE